MRKRAMQQGWDGIVKAGRETTQFSGCIHVSQVSTYDGERQEQ
jgi:hypothetical protein